VRTVRVEHQVELLVGLHKRLGKLQRVLAMHIIVA
jgi:hypothetical protein